jgi:hypothetical protein
VTNRGLQRLLQLIVKFCFCSAMWLIILYHYLRCCLRGVPFADASRQAVAALEHARAKVRTGQL